MSILGHVRIELTDLQREKIREKIEARERADAVQHVMDGGDLDYGRVSRMEWIATGAIVVDAEDIDALMDDNDSAWERTQRVRDNITEQVGKLTETWLDTYRGQSWLEEKVADCLEDELEYELERLQEAQAEAENDRAAGIFEEGGKR